MKPSPHLLHQLSEALAALFADPTYGERGEMPEHLAWYRARRWDRARRRSSRAFGKVS